MVRRVRVGLFRLSAWASGLYACHSVSPPDPDSFSPVQDGERSDPSGVSRPTSETTAPSASFSNKVPPAHEGDYLGIPFATELPSMQYVPEVMVDLSDNSLAYAPYTTDKWLYFVGYLKTVGGLLRMAKHPGAAPERITDQFNSSLANVLYEDGMVYFLSETILFRFPEDEPSKLERFDLELPHYCFNSDADHFFAVTLGSADVTLFDKKTLASHTIHLVQNPRQGGGGHYDVVSDGKRLYATRLDTPGRLYVIDKATSDVTQLDISYDFAPGHSVGMRDFYFKDDALWGTLYGSRIFASFSTVDGRVTPHAAYPRWSSVFNSFLEPGTPFVYLVASSAANNIYRFDTRTFEALPLLPFYTEYVRMNYGISVDASHVYFITQYEPMRNGKLGLLRVPKPPNP